MARLFLALWPDEEAGRALAALAVSVAERAKGRPVPLEKLHVTLAFLGEVEDARRPMVVEAASGLRAEEFDLVLDCVGAFRRSGVAWAGSSRPPAELVALQSKLAARLRERGFETEEREYTLHVTLARRVERAIPKAAIAPIAWRARELTLVRSETGSGRYVVEKRWDLRD